MTPTQITPLAAAANYLADPRDAQRHALDVALALVDRLPFVAREFTVLTAVRSFNSRWGVQIHVLRGDAEHFPALAAELGAVERPDVHGIGDDKVSMYRLLVGEIAGVPFEIRAYIGVQRIEVAA